MLKILLTMVGVIMVSAVAGQQNYMDEIDSMVLRIDSTENKKANLDHFILPVHSDDGGQTWLNNHYILDTAKRILYKSIYEEIGFKLVTFYFYGNKPIKALFIDTSPCGKFKGEYYFRDNSVLLRNENSSHRPSKIWNDEELIYHANQYLEDFKRICSMLNKKK
jgi:hypothetical protein